MWMEGNEQEEGWLEKIIIEESSIHVEGGTSHPSSLEGRGTSHLSIPQEHQNKDGEITVSVETGDYVSQIASRIGASLDEVECKYLKTLGAQQPQECSDTNLPADMDGLESGLQTRAP